MSHTIFALASGAGRGGIAVFRLSGPAAALALRALTGREVPAARQAARRVLTNIAGETIDDGLVLWFPGPHSFTGEDVVELHVHGGRAVAQAVGDALLAVGLRPAEAGEFSKRAVLNGKLDLTRAEGIADLVAAETAAQRRQALGQMGGALERRVEEWRRQLVHALAHLEAVIDFADDGVPEAAVRQVGESVQVLAADMTAALADQHRGERLRDGLHVAIVGAPNAGKSSLLNRIAGRDAAIVSTQAGTTRDIIEIHLDCGGWPVVLADTAGLRDAGGDIEAEGVRRALARAESADVKLVVFDAGHLPHLDRASLDLVDDNAVVVVNKADIAAAIPPTIGGHPVIVTSARSGQGIEVILGMLEREASRRLGGAEGGLTRERHRAAVSECVAALGRLDVQGEVELAAEDLRLAARALGRITGRVDVEELLDVVFRDFCIGK